MKQYYIYQRLNYNNLYRLAWAPKGYTVPKGWKQITRAEAIACAKGIRNRARYGVLHNGYAASYIYPPNPLPLPATD